MKTRTIAAFEGLDVRRIEALSDARTARVARNVYLDSGRVWRTRPGTVRIAQLPEETRGLYASNGLLRTVAPAGYASIFQAQSPTVWFDFVGDGSVYPRDDVEDLLGVEAFGSHVAVGQQHFAAIRRKSTGRVEYHWMRDRPDTAGGSVNTRVALPFSPSGGITKLSGKIIGLSQVRGTAPFSATEFGPADWTTERDAGFLPILNNATGDGQLSALGQLQSAQGAADTRQAALVVFLHDSVQVWAMDPDPLNHFLTANIPGTGTQAPRSVANVYGEPIYLSRGGFAALRMSFRSGATNANKIGAPIAPLVAGLDPTTITASMWWDAEGLYLCAAGSTVYVWQYNPGAKVTGWSVWEMPQPVVALAELDGLLHYRGEDHGVYRFLSTAATDDGADIPFDLETQFLHLDSPGRHKTWDSLMLYQQGACDISYRPEASATDLEVPVYSAAGVTQSHEKIPLVAMSESVAFRFAGTGRWRMSGLAVDYEEL